MSGPDSADHSLAMTMTRCGFCSFEDRKTYFPAFTPKTLDTNEPPLPLETFALRQSLAETRRELEHVNAELEFAKAAVIRMKETRSRVLSSIHDHEKAQRPILSVPDDVLRFIFEWAVCLGLKRRTYYLQTVDRASPWTISRTCSRWRVLAISYQPLWRNLIVPKYYIDSLSFLKLSLQRSASTECGFAVHLPLSKEEEIDRFKKGLASLLEPTSGRWHSLTIYTTCDSLNDAFRGWSFERLAQLDVDFDECSHSGLLSAAATTLRDTPMLRRVRMEHLSNHHQLDIPWGQLVFYESILRFRNPESVVSCRDNPHLRPS